MYGSQLRKVRTWNRRHQKIFQRVWDFHSQLDHRFMDYFPL